MAVKAGKLPRDLKVGEIRDRLRADGVTFEVQDRAQETLA
jgi:hypothetical protein